MQKQILLLVEDSEDDTFLFKWTFDKSISNFCIHDARNGAEAIDYLRSASNSGALPQIVLLDLKMPVLNGFDVLRWMQKQTFSSPVPVVVLSGSAQQEDKDSALRLGAVDYFVKPVNADDLQRIMGYIPSGSNNSRLAETGAHS